MSASLQLQNVSKSFVTPKGTMVAVEDFNLTVKEGEFVCLIGHSGCGMTGLSCARVIDKAKDRGVSEDVLATLGHSGIDLQKWLVGFESPESGVRRARPTARKSPSRETSIVRSSATAASTRCSPRA